MPGVTAQGFESKALTDIEDEIKDDLRSDISAALNLSTDSPLGQFVGTISERVRKLWEVGEELYAAFSVLTASGFTLNMRLSDLGLSRLGSTKSTVTATLNINAGVTVPAGSIVSVAGNPSARFVTIAPVTNGGGFPDDLPAEMEAEVFGPIEAPAGQLTEIETPVSGWNSATNALDATEGRLAEADSAFKLRRLDELHQAGGGTVGNVRVDLLALVGMLSVRIVENTKAIAVSGQPPHSIECVVFDGTSPAVANDDIAQAIFEAEGTATETYGTESGTAVDSEGNSHTINFSRPAIVDMYAEIDLLVTADYPDDGDAQVKEALETYGDATYKQDDDVLVERLKCEAFNVSGVKNITGFRIGASASPANTADYPIGAREIADIDTGRIVVNATRAS